MKIPWRLKRVFHRVSPLEAGSNSVKNSEVICKRPIRIPLSDSITSDNTTSECETSTTIKQSARHEASVVHFDRVETRIYNRILGDHPDIEYPLGIGWQFSDTPRMSVDDFETIRESSPNDTVSSRTTAKYLEPCDRSRREYILRVEGGLTPKQIIEDERRRKVQIVLEWAYRQDRKDLLPCTCRNAEVFIRRYIK